MIGKGLVMRTIGLLFLLAALPAFAEDTVVIGRFSGDRPESRAVADIPFRHDMRRVRGVSFELLVDDTTQFGSFSFHFRSGNGWYTANFEPGASGERTRIFINKESVRSEDSPSGWKDVDQVRVSGWRGGTQDARMTVGPIRLEGGDADVLVVQALSLLGRGRNDEANCTGLAERMMTTLNALHVNALTMADNEIDQAALAGVKALFFPYNPRIPDALAGLLDGFAAAGGRIFATYDCDARLKRMIGVSTGRWTKVPAEIGTYGGFVRVGKGLAGQPAYCSQGSRMTYVVEAGPEAEVVACWGTEDRSLNIPALVRGRRGVYMGHVWRGGVRGESLDLMKSVVVDMVPDYGRRLAALEAEERRRRKEEVDFVASCPPGPAGEFRAFWCHSPNGLPGKSWDEAAAILQRHGFNALIVNLAWGGAVAYPSAYLPLQPSLPPGTDRLAECLAACRRHGIQVHAWKVCWNLGWDLPESFTEKMRAAGRLQKGSDGKEVPWLCPSHPDNLKLEADVMEELAKRGPDGIHFDYIRYPNSGSCFCDRCRKQFEAEIGKPVSGWPWEVRPGGALAAKWTAFRSERITALVREVSRRVRQSAAPVKISAAVFNTYRSSAEEVGQDWSAWVREGLLDFACPMDYANSTGVFVGMLRTQKVLDGRVAIYPGIGLSSTGAAVDGRNRRVAEQILECRKAGYRGFSIFNFDAAALEALPLLSRGPTRAQGEGEGK